MPSERRTPDSRTKPAAPPRRGLLRSLILDLFAAKPRWRSDGTQWEPAARWARGGGTQRTTFGGAAWLVGIVLIAAGAFFLLPYLSEPVLRLKLDPPASFVSIHAQNEINEREWGRAYWLCARELQSRYTYAAPLPDEPPPQFHIPQERTLPPDQADQFRQLYWAQVQKAWLNPDAWETSHPNAHRWLPNW